MIGEDKEGDEVYEESLIPVFQKLLDKSSGGLDIIQHLSSEPADRHGVKIVLTCDRETVRWSGGRPFTSGILSGEDRSISLAALSVVSAGKRAGFFPYVRLSSVP